jgi:hypothetical protein
MDHELGYRTVVNIKTSLSGNGTMTQVIRMQ